jgi:hypothetical protein
LRDSLASEEFLEEAAMRLALDCLARTKQGDAEQIWAELPESDLGVIQERLAALQAAAARHAENGSVFRADGKGWPMAENA